MKKAVKMIGAGVAVVLVCIFMFVIGSNWYTRSSEGEVEQKEIQDITAIVQADDTNETKGGTEKEEVQIAETVQNTIADETEAKTNDFKASTTSEGSSFAENVKVNKEQIVFISGDEDGFSLSREEAVEKAMTGVDITEPGTVTYYLNALNTASGKFYSGYVDISKEKSYCFTVNAMTGNVKESSYCYKEEDSNMVWTLASTSSVMFEKIIHEYDMEAFDSIELDLMNLVDCEIVLGDTYSVNAHFYGKNFTLDSEIKDKTLYLSSKNNDSQQNRTSYVTITVPDKKVLQQLLVKNIIGSVTLTQIDTKDTDLNITTGDLSITDCEFEKLKAQVVCGNIELDRWTKGDLNLSCTCNTIACDEISGGTVQIQASCGNVWIGTVKGTDSFRIEESNADVNITEIDGIVAYISNTCGNTFIEKTTECQLTLSDRCGNIQVNEILGGTVKTSNTMGDLTVSKITKGKLDTDNNGGTVEIEGVGTSGEIDIRVDSFWDNVTVNCDGIEEAYSYTIDDKDGTNLVGSKSYNGNVKETRSTGNSIYINNQGGKNTITFAE